MRKLFVISAAVVLTSPLAVPASACPGHGAFGYSNRGYQRIYEMYAQKRENGADESAKTADAKASEVTRELLKTRAKARFLSRFNVQPGPTNTASLKGAMAAQAAGANKAALTATGRKPATVSTLDASR